MLPIVKPPIRNGWVAIEDGHVVALGRHTPDDGAREVDLGRAAILPGLVNAHTHLELSYLHERIPPSASFVKWASDVVATRRQHPDPNEPEITKAIGTAIEQAVAAGTALVGDISNTLVTYGPLAASPLGGVVFYELIRFRADGAVEFVDRANRALDALPPAPRLRLSLAAHAPYSVSGVAFQAIGRAAERRPAVPWSAHLAESAEEMEFLRTAGGPWREFLERIGSWDPSFVAPGVSPIEYLDDAGLVGEKLLAVHGVQMSQEDLFVLAARGASLVTCPRSNGHTGAGAPPVGDFYRSGVRVAIGTDSLASTPDLNVFAELATLRALAPDVPAARLLASATLEGARALGFGADYGSIAPGKSDRLIAVSLSGPVEDVEECLVEGVGPEQIRWLASPA